MKTGEDFRREFPDMEAGFRQAAAEALQSLPEANRSAWSKPRMALLLAVVFVLSAAVGMAAAAGRWGVLDFIHANPKTNPGMQTSAALANGFTPKTLDTPCAAFTITEAVYDGMATYILVEAVPKNEGIMIVPGYLHDGAQACSYSKSYPADMTIDEYAAQQGYSGIIPVLFGGSEISAHVYDSFHNEDGTFSIMIWSFVRPEYRFLDALPLHFSVSVYDDAPRGCSLTIPVSGAVQRVRSGEGESVVLSSAGIEINGVELIKTTMTTYCLMDYDIIDLARQRVYAMYRPIRILDDVGAAIPRGANPLYIRIGANHQGMGDQLQYISTRQIDSLPDHITIGEYDGNQEEGWIEGKTHTFFLQ
ncbi:MAG: hypothetical protein IJ438_06520 [Clostridia bacterium]|nr:hypothetical protein [Clostridia bacterium]